jgi:hypothetical protein
MTELTHRHILPGLFSPQDCANDLDTAHALIKADRFREKGHA